MTVNILLVISWYMFLDSDLA